MASRGVKPATKSDKIMSKRHIKAGKKLLKMSEKYNKKHMEDHKVELMRVRKAMKSKYVTTRSK